MVDHHLAKELLLQEDMEVLIRVHLLRAKDLHKTTIDRVSPAHRTAHLYRLMVLLLVLIIIINRSILLIISKEFTAGPLYKHLTEVVDHLEAVTCLVECLSKHPVRTNPHRNISRHKERRLHNKGLMAHRQWHHLQRVQQRLVLLVEGLQV